MKKLTKAEIHEALCPLGKRIRTSKKYWQYIVKIKHRELKGKLSDTLKTIEKPDEIRFDESHPEIYLYYRRINHYWICAAVRTLNNEGFLVTAYLTSKHKKKGALLWQKNKKR